MIHLWITFWKLTLLWQERWYTKKNESIVNRKGRELDINDDSSNLNRIHYGLAKVNPRDYFVLTFFQFFGYCFLETKCTTILSWTNWEVKYFWLYSYIGYLELNFFPVLLLYYCFLWRKIFVLFIIIFKNILTIG